MEFNEQLRALNFINWTLLNMSDSLQSTQFDSFSNIKIPSKKEYANNVVNRTF